MLLNKYMDKLAKENAELILGSNFKYKLFFDEKIDIYKTLSFEFINKSNISNCDKLQYINIKINELKKNGFIDVEDLKIPKVGRYIVIRLKTIEDYKKEKEIIEQESINKINLINEKILILSKSVKT